MMSGRKRDEITKEKLSKVNKMKDQDFISKLPQPLIVHILSMLELKDAVKTSVLAKTWKNIWTQVHNIVLDCRLKTDDEDGQRFYYDDDEHDCCALFYNQQLERGKSKCARWISSIDGTLMRCTSTSIDRFFLDCHWLETDYVKDKWVPFALDRNVKIMKLTLYYRAAPDCLFQSSSITRMELVGLILPPSAPVYMSSLKSLRLDDVKSDDATLEKLVMGCPVLENLILYRVVYKIHHINVMSPSVKNLILQRFEHDGDDNDFLNIKAPWVKELEISDIFYTTHCHIVDVSSLEKTTLTFHHEFPPGDIFKVMEEDVEDYNERIEYSYKWILMVMKLLNSLSYIGELVIGSEPIQALLLSKLSGTASPLFMCKHLSIETHIWKFDLPGIACLLENAPHLETLLIKVVPFSYSKDNFPLYQTQILFHDGDPHLNMPNGTFSHLKYVKIEYCQRLCHDNIKDNHGGFFDLELIEYILKSSVVLEKLALCSSRGWSCSDSKCLVPYCSFQYVPSMCSKLRRTFLRETEAAGWKFKESKNKLEFTFSDNASLLSIADSPSSST